MNRYTASSDLQPLTNELVGRLPELAEIDRFLDPSQRGMRSLLLNGQAGIGKTTLWKASISRATDRGFRVLSSRPTEIETQLSFSALVDLFRDLADDFLPKLPEPQRTALEAALMRTTADSPPAPLGVSLGVLGVIRAAAEQAPLLIAIDDIPWLDPSSARALEFAFRRLDDCSVGLLAAQRTTASTEQVPELVASVASERRALIEVTPVSLDDTADIVRRGLRVEFRRPTLARIHELSGGNAFYALEIGRAISRRDDSLGPDELPVPASLDALIHNRIDALPAASLEVALYAAALSAPSRDVLDAALGSERVEAGLAEAADSGVLESDGRAVRFSHPLLAAAIYGRAGPQRRRDVHRTLADVVAEPEERARHLALAVAEPDAVVADALEQAARIALARGAAAAAAELAVASVRLTPAADDASRRRRAMAAADHHVTAGDVPLARSSLEHLLTETGHADQGPILAQLGQILIFMGDMRRAAAAFREALALAGDDLGLRARIEMGLAGVAYLTGEDWTAGEEHIAAALADAEKAGDPVLLLQAIGHFASWQSVLGRGLPQSLVDRAASLEQWRPDVIVLEHPDLQFARILAQFGDTVSARRLIERLLDDARRRGDWSSQPYVLDELALIERLAGNWDVSDKHSEDSRIAAIQSAQDTPIVDGGNTQVRMLALRGDEMRCRALAAEYLRISEGISVPVIPRQLLTSLALLELSLGDPGAASGRLEQALRLLPPARQEPSNLRPTVPLAVEAFIGIGRLQEAEVLLDSYEEPARQLARTISIGDASMCRALLLAARLDLDPALASADEAVRSFESLALPFETARALLVLAEVRRRARKKAAAREAATQSLAIFGRLGAERWADRARAELDRSRARRTPGAELTDTEMRVADLAAAGQTNREIADGLFMSVHTVEAHLTRIYRTLGVHTRTELARQMFERGAPD